MEIGDIAGTLGDLIKEGKIRHYGLSKLVEGSYEHIYH